MRVKDLLAALDEFRSKLIEHQKLWSQSLSQPMPDYAVRNIEALETQTSWLTRRLGALRPYIERFDNQWLMVHPATGCPGRIGKSESSSAGERPINPKHYRKA
jgi:hypothetical protein